MQEQPANPVEQTLLRVSARAFEEGLDNFLLVGGNAMIIYGVPRSTRDVDFLIPEREEKHWRILLESCGYRFGHGTPGFSQFFPLEDSSPRVDLMLVDHTTWEKLAASAELRQIAPHLALRLPAPLHLIAMKLRAATSSTRVNAPQDWSDIVELIVRHDFQLADPAFRELVITFGGEAAVSTIEQRLAKRRDNHP